MSPRRRLPIRGPLIRRKPPIRKPPIRKPIVRKVVRRHRRRIWRRTRRIIVGTAVILLIANSKNPIKIRKNAITIIEKDANKNIEEMTEEDILAVMKKKGIQKLELTPEDEDKIDAVAEEQGKDSKFCTQCGAELEAADKFCSKCGVKAE